MINPKLLLAFADTKAFLNEKKWQELITTHLLKLHYNLYTCMVYLCCFDLYCCLEGYHSKYQNNEKFVQR